MKKSPVSYLLTMILLVSNYCLSNAWGAEVMINSREVRIARIVERYVATHFQSFDSLSYEMVLKNEGDKVIVFFKLPDGAIGGTPTVILRKDSFEVIQAYRNQ